MTVPRDNFPERSESLWELIAAPTVWAAHFLASYLTVAIWCARAASRSEGLGAARLSVAVYTLIAAGLILWFGWRGFRKSDLLNAELPHDDATPGDRHRFLGFAGLLLSTLSFVATLFVAAVLLFVETCE